MNKDNINAAFNSGVFGKNFKNTSKINLPPADLDEVKTRTTGKIIAIPKSSKKPPIIDIIKRPTVVLLKPYPNLFKSV